MRITVGRETQGDQGDQGEETNCENLSLAVPNLSLPVLPDLAVKLLGLPTYQSPSCNFAASDIMSFVHGGSHTISTFALVTPGTLAAF